MAFSFLDLFPDSQAAVAGSQGAKSILEDQYKQSMGFMDMEKALMQTAAAKQMYDRQKQEAPLQRTMDLVKMVQGMNTIGAANPLSGIDLNDMDQVQAALTAHAQSPTIKSGLEADILQKEAAAREATARAQMIEGGRNSRDSADRTADQRRENEKAANAHLKDLLELYAKPLSPTQANGPKGRSVEAAYNGLAAYGDTAALRSFWNVHSGFLSAKGIQAPSGAKKAAPAKTNTPAQPKTFEYKGRKFQLKGSEVQEIK